MRRPLSIAVALVLWGCTPVLVPGAGAVRVPGSEGYAFNQPGPSRAAWRAASATSAASPGTSAVLPALEEKSVFSRGRFGAWKYEVSNQDHSFMQGVVVVNRLLLQERETTLSSSGR